MMFSLKECNELMIIYFQDFIEIDLNDHWKKISFHLLSRDVQVFGIIKYHILLQYTNQY